MSTLEYTIYGIKRGWKVTRTFVFAGGFAAAIVSGLFTSITDDFSQKIAAMVLFSIWALIFGFKVHNRFSSQTSDNINARRVDLELGLLLVLATHAGVQISGGLSSGFYPSIFALTAFLIVYTRLWVGFTLVAATIGIEFALITVNPAAGFLSESLLHAAFISLFSVLNLIFTHTEIARMRRHARVQIEDEKIRITDDAINFRLTSATSCRHQSTSIKEEETRLSTCTVKEVRKSIYYHVDLLRQTMSLNTCLVLWLDEKVKKLRIIECVSSSDNIEYRDFGSKEGVVGGVLQSGKAIVLKGLRPGYPGISYYENESEITDFIGIPIKDGNIVKGVLIADRQNNKNFEQKEKDILFASVESILQNVSNERIFVQLQKAKSEQGKLLRASESLSRALNEKDVVDAALDAAAQIAQFDIAAVSLIDEKNTQTIKCIRGDDSEMLTNLSLGANIGMVASVVKNRHFLPYRGEFDYKTQIVFSKKVQKVFKNMQSLLLLPLIAGDEVLGTLLIATTTPKAYTEEIRTTLQVMINQLGTSIQNAAMVRKLEEMATTDGLTGLPNHRSFQDELTRQLAQSNRVRNETSIILCDVDKFKNVNDVYGHPVGDIVLKELGHILRKNVVRDTDMPARYGGEEFIIICGGTGTDGAMKLGNRIREELENQTFNTDKGSLTCTISMGVATFPNHALNKEDLIERADTALYAAKEGGRNQLQVWKKDF